MSQQFKIENSIIGMFKKILEYKNVHSNIQMGGGNAGVNEDPPPGLPASEQETDEIQVVFKKVTETYETKTTEGEIKGFKDFNIEFRLQELIGHNINSK